MKNPMQQLLDAGQSVWLDNVRRSMFDSGELKRLIDLGLRGMTSNPTIFEKAIGAGDDYDEQLRSLIGTEKNADALFWDLAVQDIQDACDAFAGVYESSKGNDGFVSLEVSPLLANDTAGTVAMAKSLWKRVDRPNVMIKIPGTREGIPAIEEAIYEGLNVNVTLIFSVQMYANAAEAYIRGLERRVAEHKPIDRIRSVNSVFVSRVDSAVDKILKDRIVKGEDLKKLQGKTGVASLKIVYAKFKELFEDERFAKLRKHGGTPQRPLWASTSTKNPDYPDLMYVETVVGPETVNTMPPQTLQALLDHGRITPDTVESDVAGARADLDALQDANISLFDVTHELQLEGVSLFSDSFAALIGAIVYKQKQLASGAERVALSLPGETQATFDAALATLVKNDFLKRMWAKDPTLWSTDPDAAELIKHSLGWLDIPQHMLESVRDLSDFGKEVAKSYTHAVVLGMGGSSLAPDIMRVTFGHTPGYPELHVLDSTAPEQIAALEAEIDIDRTLFIVSSKSGSTTEPNAFFAYFFDKVAKRVGSDKAGSRFIAITDADSPLVKVADANGFRRVFKNDPNIGGRYSALSDFGMVPAAIGGYNVTLLLDRGLGAMHGNENTSAPSSALRLGAAMGGLALAGRNKVTIVTHPAVKAFGAWAEQLIAESTGKLGKGIVPVEGERLGDPADYGDDRFFAYVGANLPDPDPATEVKLKALESAGHPVARLAMNDAYDVGEQYYVWEVATAAAGSLLGIDVFDQPNVQESKDNTKALLEQYAKTGKIDEPEPDVKSDGMDVTFLPGSASLPASDVAAALAAFTQQTQAGDYVAITAYVARNEEHDRLLQAMRLKIRDARKVATTVGFGPRFLHSTGQLHKGGPNTAVMLQITADEKLDQQIPGMNVGFRTLLAAQALGDWSSLASRHRRGIRVHLRGGIDEGLRALAAAIDEALTARA